MKPITGVLLVALGFLALTFSGVALAQETTVERPTIEQVDGQKYRIGEIVVDKAGASFTVPGKVLVLEDPLEYLAVSLNGSKGYESLLELNTSPTEFNLACILIGLDDTKSIKPRYQFDERPAVGQAVTISISFEKDGETVEISGASAMTEGDETFSADEWVYIGSTMSADGQHFLADMSGTLIGFVHDPLSIIDHVSGGGIGAYGLMTGNEDILPPVGSPISLTVTLVGD